jgi:hypothetical protein
MIATIKKTWPVQFGVQFLLVCAVACCQDNSLSSRKPEGVKAIKAIIDRVRREGEGQIIKELGQLSELFREPDPALAAIIITDPLDVVYKGIPEALIAIGRFEQFRKSILELTESNDERIQKAIRSWLPRMEHYPEDLTDPLFVLRTDEEYILRYLKASRRLPECYVDSLYLASPALALATMFYAHHVAQGIKHEEIMKAYRSVRWVIHLVEVANWRREHGFLTAEEIQEVQRKLKWLWDTYPHWWARRYVLEIILKRGHEIFRYQGWLDDLEKEKHPLVRKRYESIKKSLQD